jgi:uncharacterized membrane protein YoaK (UPF0700 family)
MLVEAALLAVAATLLIKGVSWGASLAAMAAGLQNALATSYSGAVVRTTHMTGIVTDLGVHFGHALRGEPVEWWRVRLLGLLFGSFLTGGLLAAALFPFLRAWALVPAAVLIGGGAIYFLWRLSQPEPSPRPSGSES